jgi:hypothetical protein
MKHSVFLFGIGILFFGMVMESFDVLKDKNLPSAPISYPSDYFISPIEGKLQLTGTFGELRHDHFHGGIDIRPNIQGGGDPVFSIADGYVSKITVDPDGYGNRIQIIHPNGYSSLYAHLGKWSDALKRIVEDVQYREKSFKVEINFQDEKIALKKGEIIGYIGNSGSSTGPHLHFEIRDTKGDRLINPLLFGFPVQDNVAPKINAIKFDLFGNSGELLSTIQKNLVHKNGKSKIAMDTIEFGASTIGVSIKTYDQMNGSGNLNGIYGIKMLIDDKETYEYKMETFELNETRFINAHTDYFEKARSHSYFNRCYLLPGNSMKYVYRNIGAERGMVLLQSDKVKKVDLISTDISGNESKCTFWVKRNPQPSMPETKLYNYHLVQGKKHTISHTDCEIDFPAGALYEDCFLDFKVSNEPYPNLISSKVQLHRDDTPIHTPITIFIKPNQEISDSLKRKCFLGKHKEFSTVFIGNNWELDGRMKSNIKTLGSYGIFMDVKPPVIQSLNLKPDMAKAESIRFRVFDNIKAFGNRQEVTYNAFVDDQWILFEYDEKSRTLKYTFDERISKGNHALRLEVQDQVGNTSIFQYNFSR